MKAWLNRSSPGVHVGFDEMQFPSAIMYLKLVVCIEKVVTLVSSRDILTTKLFSLEI